MVPRSEEKSAPSSLVRDHLTGAGLGDDLGDPWGLLSAPQAPHRLFGRGPGAQVTQERLPKVKPFLADMRRGERARG